jgi:hypothetical protein
MNLSMNRRGFTRADLSVAVVAAVAAVGLLLPACSSSISTSQNAESEKNIKDLAQSAEHLKEMGRALRDVAARTDGLQPNAVGNFPSTAGVYGTIFCNILTDIEEGEVFKKYRADFTKTPSTVAIKMFRAPADPSNPGDNALCSYASNAAVFGVGEKDGTRAPNGGFARYPAMFNIKGTSNTIIFFEHFAQPVVDAGGTTVSNYWYSPSTALYGNAWNQPTGSVKAPQFDLSYKGPDPYPDNATAHGFVKDSLVVGLADGSARTLTKKVTEGGGRAWLWACTLVTPIANAPRPEGW